jgi:uncharacterized protein YbjT (DUF2867 family)
VLRAGFYTTMLFRYADTDGVIAGPDAGGRVSFLAHDDLADVAAATLLEVGAAHDGVTYEVTGPHALSLAAAAAQLRQLTGRSYRYHPQQSDEARQELRRTAAADADVTSRLTWFEAIAHGEAAPISDTVVRLTGHPATGTPADASLCAEA